MINVLWINIFLARDSVHKFICFIKLTYVSLTSNSKVYKVLEECILVYLNDRSSGSLVSYTTCILFFSLKHCFLTNDLLLLKTFIIVCLNLKNVSMSSAYA